MTKDDVEGLTTAVNTLRHAGQHSLSKLVLDAQNELRTRMAKSEAVLGEIDTFMGAFEAILDELDDHIRAGSPTLRAIRDHRRTMRESLCKLFRIPVPPRLWV